VLALAVAAGAARAETFVWVDEHGTTHITDDPKRVPESARGRLAPEGERGTLWSDGFQGPPLGADRGAASVEEERVLRLLRGAADDLARGETARASGQLEAVLRLAPARPEAHWYLALLDRQRGRHESSEAHLRAFLASAGDELAAWRASAERRLAALGDEKRLADETQPRGPLRLLLARSENFRIRYDAALGDASPDYAATVSKYLEEARAFATSHLGVVPSEPTGVVLYGKAAYLEAHRHRFSFPTVGFFDGEIHVASAAHPAGELRALLFHEYTHAVFREQAGSDRPFWLNEGLAELAGRAARRQPGLSRGDHETLRRRIDAGRWIPLQDLADGFSGLEDDDARGAYLQSTAAAAFITERTTPAQRAALLGALGRGEDTDRALRASLGRDTAALDAAARAEVVSQFASSERALQGPGAASR
jgi:hypothetical protein